jgi:hypothetical protein
MQPVELGISYAVMLSGKSDRSRFRVMTARPGGVRLKQSGLSAFTAGLWRPCLCRDRFREYPAGLAFTAESEGNLKMHLACTKAEA